MMPEPLSRSEGVRLGGDSVPVMDDVPEEDELSEDLADPDKSPCCFDMAMTCMIRG